MGHIKGQEGRRLSCHICWAWLAVQPGFSLRQSPGPLHSLGLLSWCTSTGQLPPSLSQALTPIICHPKRWTKALQLPPPQSTQNSLALSTKKVSGTLRSGDTKALESNSNIFFRIYPAFPPTPNQPLALQGPGCSYTPEKTLGQSWRHWAPCPRWPVSCSAR